MKINYLKMLTKTNKKDFKKVQIYTLVNFMCFVDVII